MRLFLLYSLFGIVWSRYSCKGLKGENVDWFLAYKAPGGTAMYYADGSGSEWKEGKELGNDGVGVGATLAQLYKKEPTSFYFVYNDEAPGADTDSYRGHAKGTLVFDSSTGFWLIHSAPNFPPTSSYSFPSTAKKYGQSFICITLSTDQLGDIGDQLRFMQATPYLSNLPDKFATRFPVLRNIVAKQSLPKSATIFTSIKTLKTSDGSTFTHFAKHKKFGKDLWLYLVAPNVETDLAVESWLNGGAVDLGSSCSSSPYKVFDIQSVQLPNGRFNSSKDHSKWAVSQETRTPVVCIGDMNRQKSQTNRGGGALCFKHSAIWKIYSNSVAQIQECPV